MRNSSFATTMLLLSLTCMPQRASMFSSLVKLHRFSATIRKQSSLKMSSDAFPMLTHKNLVSVEDCLDAYQVAATEEEQNVVFVDASWYHKGGRNGRSEYEEGPRIEGARYIDMDDIATSKELYPELNPKGLRTMMPPQRLFALAMDELGITNSDHIVIYGKEGTIFTPRTWFLFRSMGHDASKVHLMQGSLEEWIEAGGPHETESTTAMSARDLELFGDSIPSYQARDPVQVVDMTEMLQIADDKESLILDPRGSSFAKGHLPGAIHVPYSSLVEPDNWLKLKPTQELLDIFNGAEVDIATKKQIVCSCGSGVSVCHLLLALEECGRLHGDETKTVMYDGSYQEWNMDPDTPKELPSKH